MIEIKIVIKDEGNQEHKIGSLKCHIVTDEGATETEREMKNYLFRTLHFMAEEILPREANARTMVRLLRKDEDAEPPHWGAAPGSCP